MDYIIRTTYLNKIKNFVDKPIIKILTGMPRVGKSTLLTIISNELLSHIPKDNKIHVNFDSFEMLAIRDSIAFANYLSPLIKDRSGKLYFFFDEIQMVKGWEEVVNGLQVDFDCDIYITGSNSSMLSGDLSTLLAGRYINFEIQPFTFKEFIESCKIKNLSLEEYFQKYILVGGMPVIQFFDLDEETSYKYLTDVYNTVLIKDVLEYNKIRDVDLFNRILLYAMENIGHTFSATSIRKILKNEGRNASVDTILNYLEFCQKAYLIKKVKRYDAVGKRLLKIDEKYFLTDHGFRQSKGFSNTSDIERVLENIVYIELISRDYEVTIGKVRDKEIDFIAEKNGIRKYFQITYVMESEKTRQREFGVYYSIKDNFEKYVLSMDKIDFSTNGIKHMNIIDWLLGKD